MTEYDLTTFLESRQAEVYRRRRPTKMCSYEGCDRWAWARGYCGAHYQQMKREGQIQNVRIKGDVLRRFYTNIDVNPDTLCWEWTSYLHPKGYGYLTIGAENKKVRAHRYSYELFYGAVPDGLKVLHDCDVRKCSNPAHLYAGTDTDNARDCVERGRHSWQIGTNGRKLTRDMVRTMRILYARGQHSIVGLSDIYLVDHSTVSGVLKGRSHQKVR